MRKAEDRRQKTEDRGVTLLEILMAMLILGMVTGGIFTAFVFSRQVSYRSTSQLVALGMMRGTAEQLRAGTIGLAPGIYVDDFMQNAPTGSIRLNPNPLNFPPEFRARYQTDPGTAPTLAGHGDGRVMIVEGNTDLDGDGKAGVILNGQVALYRVRVKVKWTPPSP